MTEKCFQKGILLLSETFPKYGLEDKGRISLFWRMLKDLDDFQFQQGVMSIVQEVEELYPTSNLIAMIRKRGKKKEEKLMSYHKPFELRYDEKEAVPPTPEFKQLIERLSDEKSEK